MEEKRYSFSDNWLSTTEYYSILKNVDYNKCIIHPPVAPKPGEIFLIYNENHVQDWKADQYQWHDGGIKVLPRKNPLVLCRYYYNSHGSKFFRRAIILYKKGVKYSALTLLHYVGSIVGLILLPHGNKKNNLETHHIRTAKSVLDDQKKCLVNSPHKIYKNKLLHHRTNIHPALSPVLLPRNKKQVANTIYNERNKKLLSRDDIVGIYLLSHEIEDFIHHIVLAKYFHIIICSTASIKRFTEIAQNKACLLSYDTTFNMGDFYVSPLHYRHPFLQSKSEVSPVIPLAYLIHDRKVSDVHNSFFHFMKKFCPEINGVPIVTDRESGIILAIKEELPKSKIFFCWNHIRRDITLWLKNQKDCSTDDIQVYGNHVWDLLDSDTFESFHEKYKKMSVYWTQKFKSYFDKNIYEAVTATGKWILTEYNKYTPRSGITTNAAEGLNSVLKRLLEHKEVCLQVLTLTLYELDLFYLGEMVRGYCDMGNYSLKNEFKHLLQDKCKMEFEVKNTIPLENLPYAFNNKDFEITHPRDEEKPFTNFSVAKMLVLKGCVRLIPEEQAFIVTSLDKKKKYITTLFPKEECSCRSKKNCPHINAAKMSIGANQKSQDFVKLSKLMRKQRGFRSGRKKVPKNLTIVEGAEDSLNTSTAGNSTSVLIPTISTEDGIVKKRFYDLERTHDYSTNKTFSSSFILTSTPKKIKEDKDEKSDLTDTFTENFKKNRMFKIYGRNIYPSHLKSLVPDAPTASDRDLYIFDSIFDTYIPILIKEESPNNNNVKIFSVDSILINFLKESSWHDGMKYFLENKIVDYDIVFFPLVYANHCRLFVLFKKQNLAIYLDSLDYPIVPRYNIKQILKIYQACEIFNGQKSTTFNIAVPHNIPKQTNGYDCGLYVAMFCEIILKRGNFDLNRNMTIYREEIKNKLLKYMENPIPGPNRRSYNKKKLEEFSFESVSPVIMYDDSAIGNNPIKFLSSVITNYWDENSSVCVLKTEKCERGKEMVFCTTCKHWLHLECEGIEKAKLPKSYECKECQKTN